MQSSLIVSARPSFAKILSAKRHKHIVESITVLPPEKTLSAPVSFVPTQVAGSRFSALLQKSFFLSSKTFFLSSRMQKPLFSRLSARPHFPELFIFSDFSIFPLALHSNLSHR